MKIKIGDKVKIPKSKKGCIYGDYGIDSSQAIRTAKILNRNFLFYNGLSRKMDEHLLHHSYDPNHLTGDYFDITEIELYEETIPGCGYTESGERFIYCDTKASTSQILDGYTEITFEEFKEHILIKESKENLLETEFIIENCTLSQRKAIQSYCDEKNIDYVPTLLEMCSKNVFWNKKMFLQTSTLEYNKISFSDLIQFLDKYISKPKFKVGDFVVVKGSDLVGDGNGFRGKVVSKLEEVGVKKATGLLLNESDFSISVNNSQYNIKSSHIERYATSKEIKKWKEENEIKLPKIADYDGQCSNTMLSWGCTEISISTVKELLKLKTSSITLGNVHLDNTLIQLIKKFIEHNKL